jgi:hypothetical protein
MDDIVWRIGVLLFGHIGRRLISDIFPLFPTLSIVSTLP